MSAPPAPIAPPALDPALAAELLARARAARARAYAPYSGYPVGAAVLTAEGEVVAGANIENAAYGATVCAERVAAWTAVAGGARRLLAVAVITAGGGLPCGACRQVLAEFGGPELLVLAAGPAGPARVFSLGALLPEAFGAADLERARGEAGDAAAPATP